MDFNYQPFSLGFQDVVTIDMLREAYPVLDVVDHNRRPKDSVSTAHITLKTYWHTKCSQKHCNLWYQQVPPTKGLRPIDGTFSHRKTHQKSLQD